MEQTLEADLSGRHERLYTMLLDAIPSSVLLIDQNMCIVSANRNFLEKGRRTLATTIGYKLEEVFPTIILDLMNITKRIQRVIESNQPVKGERMTYRAPPGYPSAPITIASCHSPGRDGWKGRSSLWTMLRSRYA